MMDFLKAFPSFSYEDYMWRLSVPLLFLMSVDNTRVNYLSEKAVEARKKKKVELSALSDFENAGISVLSI